MTFKVAPSRLASLGCETSSESERHHPLVVSTAAALDLRPEELRDDAAQFTPHVCVRALAAIESSS